VFHLRPTLPKDPKSGNFPSCGNHVRERDSWLFFREHAPVMLPSPGPNLKTNYSRLHCQPRRSCMGDLPIIGTDGFSTVGNTMALILNQLQLAVVVFPCFLLLQGNVPPTNFGRPYPHLILTTLANWVCSQSGFRFKIVFVDTQTVSNSMPAIQPASHCRRRPEREPIIYPDFST